MFLDFVRYFKQSIFAIISFLANLIAAIKLYFSILVTPTTVMLLSALLK